MRVDEVLPGALVLYKHEVLKARMVPLFEDRVIAEVVWPIPRQPAIRSYEAKYVAAWRPLTDHEYAIHNRNIRHAENQTLAHLQRAR